MPAQGFHYYYVYVQTNNMVFIRCPSLRRFLFVFISGLVFGMVLSSLDISLRSSGIYSSAVNKLMTMRKDIFAPNVALIIEMNAMDPVTKTNLILNLINELLRVMWLQDAREDAHQVRVLCWIMTTINNHENKAKHVKQTWGQHCNILVFISDVEDSALPAVAALDAKEDRNGLWGKTVFGFTHAYEKYAGQYDWVFKADDDTFAILENMRTFLLPHPPDDPIYFGFRYKLHARNGYMSGGPGYVLSRAAVERVVKVFKNKTEGCPDKMNNNAEDINIAKCLGVAGVKTGDSRDLQGRHRFLPFGVAEHVNPDQSNKNWWYWVYIYWPIRAGYECCSPDPVSFHYIKPAMQHMLHLLVYNVTPVSVNNLAVATPPHNENTTVTQNVTLVQNLKASQNTTTTVHAQNVTFATAHTISPTRTQVKTLTVIPTKPLNLTVTSAHTQTLLKLKSNNVTVKVHTLTVTPLDVKNVTGKLYKLTVTPFHVKNVTVPTRAFTKNTTCVKNTSQVMNLTTLKTAPTTHVITLASSTPKSSNTSSHTLFTIQVTKISNSTSTAHNVTANTGNTNVTTSTKVFQTKSTYISASMSHLTTLSTTTTLKPNK